MRLSQYATLNGIAYRTAYKYFKQGIIKGHQIATGTIFIDETTKPNICEDKPDDTLETIVPISIRVVLYARVSSAENKDNLASQLIRLRQFAIAKGYTIVKEVEEIGSGLNANRRKLLAILRNNKYDIILVEHKDRFARFGIEFVEELLRQSGRRIEVINTTEDEKEDIVQDLISIITSYSAKIYGKRRTERRTEEIISELREDE